MVTTMTWPLLRILLVDDNPKFLQTALRYLFEVFQPEEIFSVNSGTLALEQVSRLRPDLVLVDLSMPGLNGFQATQRIKSLAGAPRVVILTMHNTPIYRQAAENVGADGFLHKAEVGSKLLPLIHRLFPAPS